MPTKQKNKDMNQEPRPHTTDQEILALTHNERLELLSDVGVYNPRVHRLIGRNGLLNCANDSSVELDDGITIVRGEN